MSLLKRIEKVQKPVEIGVRPPTDEARVRRPTIAPPARDQYADLKTRVQDKLLAELDPKMDVRQTEEVRRTIEELYDNILAQEALILSRTERQRLFEQIVAEILGFGPLEPLLAEESVTEIMVNGAKKIYVERKGKLEKVETTFETDEHVLRIIDRIVSPLGRRID
jgi:pilus assembly protein CpaF